MGHLDIVSASAWNELLHPSVFSRERHLLALVAWLTARLQEVRAGGPTSKLVERLCRIVSAAVWRL